MRRYLTISWCLCLAWASMAAHASDKQQVLCTKLAQQKQYLASSQCFAKMANAITNLKQQSKRFQKGRWLRNATILMTKAAKGEANAAKRSYYYELAKRQTLQYLNNKLYETSHQKRLEKLRLSSIDAKIGYTLLSISTEHKGAKITIQGFQYKASGTGAWSQKVRPGSYVVQVQYPNQPMAQQATKVSMGEPKLVSFTPPKAKTPTTPRKPLPKVVKRPKRITPIKRPKTSPVALALMIGGGVIVAGGIGALIGGFVKMNEANAMCGTIANNQCQNPTAGAKAADFHAAYDASDGLFVAGGIAAGIGAAVLVVGLLLKPKQPTTTTALPPTTRQPKAFQLKYHP